MNSTFRDSLGTPGRSADDSARRFAHPPLVRSLALFGAGFSALFAVLVLLVPLYAPDWNNPLLLAISFVFCVGSIVVSLLMLRSSGDTFEVTEEGIGWLSPGKEPVFLAWREVADVHPENVMQRLVVADAAGRRRILIEFHLRGFGELRRIVLDRSRRKAAS